MNKSEKILSELTPENSGNWQHVGRTMLRLSQISAVSENGRPWHDVVLETLAANGQQVTTGHLYRIRRSLPFLEEGMRERDIPSTRAALAKISSVDQAWRLFQLDREAGFDALEACLDIENPATLSDIRKRYDDYHAAHPEKKTPMHAAWDRRRSKQDKPDLEDNLAPVADVNMADRMAGTFPSHAIFPFMLSRAASYVTDLEAAAKRDAATILALKQRVLDLKAELAHVKMAAGQTGTPSLLEADDDQEIALQEAKGTGIVFGVEPEKPIGLPDFDFP